jgi:hypothetical protein
MESQLSVLLYSKYSSLSKNLMNMIQTSGVDFTEKFSLQPLCIDNEEIRARIIKNTQIQVTTVPCLLIIFPDGGIEKYDGAHVFEWVEGIIRQSAPPPPPVPAMPTQTMQSEEEKWRIQQAHEKQRIEKQKIRDRKQIANENRRKYEEKYEEPRDPSPHRERPSQERPSQERPSQESPRRSRRERPREENPRRRRVRKEYSVSPEHRKEQESSGVTAINDLDDLEDLDDYPQDEDDDLVADRYRSRKPVGRIRTDVGNYEEGEELFQGAPPNMRRARRSAVKNNTSEVRNAKTEKSLDLMAKAKAMAKGRENSGGPPPPGHPMNERH